MKITIKKAEKEDLKRILEIQHLAFQKEAADFHNFNMGPMRQTLADLEKEFETFTFLKALDEKGEIIGSSRGYVKDRTSYIDKTFVHPDYQGQGAGTKMIAVLEKMNPAPRYEIYASIRCPQNIKLYERLGFVRFRETHMENNGHVYMEKLVSAVPDMRRTEREVKSFDDIADILKRCDTVRIGIQGAEYPYVVPVSFGMEVHGAVITIYFHGARSGYKNGLLAENSKVCVEGDIFSKVEPTDYGITTRYESVIGFGTTEMVGEEEKIHGLQTILDHYGYSEYPVGRCKGLKMSTLYKVTLTRITGKRNL